MEFSRANGGYSTSEAKEKAVIESSTYLLKLIYLSGREDENENLMSNYRLPYLGDRIQPIRVIHCPRFK